METIDDMEVQILLSKTDSFNSIHLKDVVSYRILFCETRSKRSVEVKIWNHFPHIPVRMKSTTEAPSCFTFRDCANSFFLP